MLNSLPPRFFCNFTVPKRADGSPLSSCQESGDYEYYLRWLADYLHTVEIPLSAEQESWLQSRNASPESVIFQCSDAFGYAIDSLEDLNGSFDNGEDYSSYRAHMLSVWEDLDVEQREEDPFEDWLDLDKATFERLRRERVQEKNSGIPWSHADIPFRSLLAWALHQMPNRDERYHQLDWFFRNFQDNASK
jgi:hypothetical protein